MSRPKFKLSRLINNFVTLDDLHTSFTLVLIYKMGLKLSVKNCYKIMCLEHLAHSWQILDTEQMLVLYRCWLSSLLPFPFHLPSSIFRRMYLRAWLFYWGRECVKEMIEITYSLTNRRREEAQTTPFLVSIKFDWMKKLLIHLSDW